MPVRSPKRARVVTTDKPLAHQRSAVVQEKVAEAAVELAEVNDVLSEELGASGPTPEVERAISQSEDVEVKVEQAAKELVAVTHTLEAESGERAELEQKLEVSVTRPSLRPSSSSFAPAFSVSKTPAPVPESATIATLVVFDKKTLAPKRTLPFPICSPPPPGGGRR